MFMRKVRDNPITSRFVFDFLQFNFYETISPYYFALYENQGLIHRDLKPSNCFMDDSELVKIGKLKTKSFYNMKTDSTIS